MRHSPGAEEEEKTWRCVKNGHDSSIIMKLTSLMLNCADRKEKFPCSVLFTP